MRRWITAIVIVVILAGGFFAFRAYSAQRQTSANPGLQIAPVRRGALTATIGATGIVRANQTAILNWQTSGTVGEVLVEIGDRVTAGDVLAELERTSLPQNVILAQADLLTAQRALEDLLNSDVQRAQALKALNDAEQALEDARNPELSQAQALKAVTDAQKAVEEAERAVVSARTPANQSYIDEAEAQVVLAKDRLDKARERFAPYENKPEDNLTRARLQSDLSAAQQAYDAAVRRLNSLQGTASETDQAVREANLEAAKAQLMEAQREYERLKDGPTEADIALLEAEVEDARRAYERVKDGASEADIRAAEARVAAAQATLNQARLTAPFDATVTKVVSLRGDQVAPGVQAFRLDDLSHLYVDVQVSEVDINHILPGQDAILTFDAILGKEYRGKVIRVDLVGTSEQGVVDFTVTIELTNADEQVLPGMTAAVNIVVQELEDVLLVPNRAVRVVDGQRVVYVLQNGAPEAVPITLGASSEVDSEVVDGDLQEGDAVVLNPPTLFDQGGPPFMGR